MSHEEAAAGVRKASRRTWTAGRFEIMADKTSRFASGPWGTQAGFGLLMFWIAASAMMGWDQAYGIVDEVVTMSSFLLLFLLQRSQAKDTLAIQVKLNELLAAVHKASPTLINLEDRPEAEVREIHDLFQEVLARRGAASSIEDVQRN